MDKSHQNDRLLAEVSDVGASSCATALSPNTSDTDKSGCSTDRFQAWMTNLMVGYDLGDAIADGVDNIIQFYRDFLGTTVRRRLHWRKARSFDIIVPHGGTNGTLRFLLVEVPQVWCVSFENHVWESSLAVLARFYRATLSRTLSWNIMFSIRPGEI
mmetsp:Transcript_795/g.2054  ORF Transcript_795/g.2054 Transcript_795/m.2054 type:complete len:157 (-) Transcript_795:1400-1870(-)